MDLRLFSRRPMSQESSVKLLLTRGSCADAMCDIRLWEYNLPHRRANLQLLPGCKMA